MKTPDEIKKALECCFNAAQCGDCPYYPVSCDRELVRDAREYIRQLEKENERLEYCYDVATDLESEMYNQRKEAESLVHRWISVKERLPEYGRCLVAVKLTNRKTIKTATYNEHGWWIDLPAFDSEITHWMPLPELPKEE